MACNCPVDPVVLAGVHPGHDSLRASRMVRQRASLKHEILNYDRDGLVSTMGMVSVCHRGPEKKGDEELECHNFDEDFPSSSWQTSYVLFGSGCVLLTWCSILAFCNVWIIGKKNRQLVAMLIGRIQLVAVQRKIQFITSVETLKRSYSPNPSEEDSPPHLL
ncbi:uncharacterized protein CEXT_440071 [Caerostris extrusa]|uniref:Uncharacterized protein n=1 Tax=Caerostris extrusa TaxID=172846 RepID=A0AAV4XK99_CAEEX|nr:uncharacterized protein CEXT_440071 [Caerostris extrusa]